MQNVSNFLICLQDSMRLSILSNYGTERVVVNTCFVKKHLTSSLSHTLKERGQSCHSETAELLNLLLHVWLEALRIQTSVNTQLNQ